MASHHDSEPTLTQPVFDTARQRSFVFAQDQTVAFQIPERLREHLLRDAVDSAQERSVAHRSCRKRGQDQHRPFGRDQLERIARRARRIVDIAMLWHPMLPWLLAGA